MTDEVDALAHLIDRHPLVFRGREPRVASHLSIGWFDLVDQLCTDVERALGDNISTLEVDQIKEKFGRLRFYYTLDWRRGMVVDLMSQTGIQTISNRPQREKEELMVAKLVEEAEERSKSICLTCASPAQLANHGGYIAPLCDTHAPATSERRGRD